MARMIQSDGISFPIVFNITNEGSDSQHKVFYPWAGQFDPSRLLPKPEPQSHRTSTAQDDVEDDYRRRETAYHIGHVNRIGGPRKLEWT